MEDAMNNVNTIYDSPQHCVSTKSPQNLTVETDCPYTGKGEEFSPGDLLESALAGCMLISMGTLAMRSGIDLTGTKIEVNTAATDKPIMRYTGITVNVTMNKKYNEKDRQRLERATDACPIKHSFRSDIPVTANYNYPE
jgi:putative redox protein